VPRRILYVHHRTELGGAPASLSYLIAQLDEREWEPHVYCPGGPAADLFRSVGATVHVGPVASFTHIWASTYSGRRWLLLLRELLRLPGHAIGFRRTLRRLRFDVVHLNDSPLVFAARAARRAGIPVVWHLRSALPEPGGRRGRLLRRTIRRNASAAIAINTNVGDSFDVGAVVVPNTVDLARFHPGDAEEARAAAGLPRGKPVVSFFGFVYPYKGFRDFIRAAAFARARGVDATYLVVGGDVRGAAFFRRPLGRLLELLGMVRDHERDARALVAELGLESSFRFVAFTRDTPAIYRASDVVVAPSRGPELGRPVLEAGASGRVVVASGSVDGAGILLPDETGFLVPRRSPDSIAAAVGLLVGDDDLRARMGESARAHAEATYDARANAARVVDVYEAVLAR
jgi:glycosyltransferase involved in cell wall biosynthesis